ncbi:MAG: hypothetical protein ABI120_24855 [Gemmatimonadaceae bacterium]
MPSHFNISTAFDAAVYATMGMVISINTVIPLMLAIFASFAWKPNCYTTTAERDARSETGELFGIPNGAERAGIICGLWLIVLDRCSAPSFPCTTDTRSVSPKT